MPVINGTIAPAFTLEDAAESRPYSLEQALQNGPVVVGLYKSSCGASKAMFPVLERLHQHYGSSNVTFLGISQDSPNVTRSFIRRSGVNFPMLVETEGYPVSQDYDIEATPTVFLIRQDGTVEWQGMGFQLGAAKELNSTIAELTGMEPADLESDMDDTPPWVPG